MIQWLLLFLIQAHAQTVLVQAPRSPGLDYLAMLKAHSNFVSPSRFYRAKHPLVSEREQLIAAFAEAQKAFLGDSIASARKAYKAVLDLVWADDWERSDREIFLQAYLRLAQTESDSAARDRWLTQSLLLGDDVNVDATLFPPPLLLRRRELSRQATVKVVSKVPAGWNDLLVNGRSCAGTDCKLLSLGKVRVTLLSDQWLPHTEILDINEIDRLAPAPVALVRGACGQEDFHAETAKYPVRKAFWNLDCEERVGASRKLKLTPQLNASIFTPAPGPVKFYQSKWFWIGAGGVVVIAAVVIANSQRHEVRDTSTSYGY